MADERVVDQNGHTLGSLVTYNISDGFNSPYPTDGSGPVPSMNATVAVDESYEMLFNIDTDVSLQGEYLGGNSGGTRGLNQVTSFEGRISTVDYTSKSSLASFSIDGIARAFNQEITTFPIVGSDGWLVRNTLFHWFAECGLFRYMPKGIMEMQIQNIAYGMGYYNHPSLRLLPVHFRGNNTTQWVPTDSVALDPGISLDNGEKIHFVSTYGFQGTEFPNTNLLIRFQAGAEEGDDSNPADTTAVGLRFRLTKPSTFTLSEVYGNSNTTLQTINIGTNWNNIKIDTEVMRNSGTSIRFETRLFVSYLDGKASATFTNVYTKSDSRLMNNLSIQNIDHTALDGEDFNGLDTFYIDRTDQFINGEYYENFLLTGMETKFTIPKGAKPMVPGLSGNAWQMINEFCSIYNMIFDATNLSLGNADNSNLLQYSVSGQTQSDVQVSANVREKAETIEIINYNYSGSNDPQDVIELWRAEDAYSLARGERREEVIQTDATWSLLDQPTVFHPNNVPVTEPGEARFSFYSVYGADNSPVTPAEWESTGGFISVEGTGTVGELRIVMQAPYETLTKAAPYTISIETSMPSLVIAGIGVRANKKTEIAYTGAGEVRTKVGTTYDSPLVCADWMVWNVAAAIAPLYGTSATEATATIKPYYQPEESWYNKPYYLRKQGAYYRVISIESNAFGSQVSSSVRHVRCGDMNTEYAGMTCAQVSSTFSGKNVQYANLAPLKRYID